MSEAWSTEQIERALDKRLAEAASVLAAGSSQLLENLAIRKYPCSAIPVAVLGDDARAERGGLQYRITFSTDASWTTCYTALVNVRIAPHRGSADPEEASQGTGAYIAIYAVDTTGREDVITWLDLGARNVFAESPASDWYARWVREALDHPRASKLFKYKQVVVS